MNNTNRQNRQNHLTTIGILLVFLIIIAMCGAIATIVLNNDETVYSEPEHVHNYGDLVEKVDATLDADGHWAYYHCEECDKYFDSNKKEIDWGDLIIYGGHSYVYHERVEPTCTQMGKHEHYTCTDCDKKFNVNKQEVAYESQLNIASLKHDYDFDNIEFTWTPADNSNGWTVSAKYVCKRCGDVVEKDASITTKSATWNQDSCIVAYIYENSKYYYSEPKSRESDAGTATINQWTPWEYDDHLPTEIQPSDSQGWYLTKDVTLAETWTVPANGTKLCLNGHVVTMTGSGSAIYVPLVSMGFEFTLCEYNFDETHYYYIGKTVTDSHNSELNFVGQIVDDESDPAYVAAARKGSFEGGYITGGTGRVIGGNTYGGAVYVEGDSSKSYIYSSKFTLQGATLFGNHADYGGAVYVATNAYFKTYGNGGRGGYIIGNQAGSEGGGVYANKRNYNDTYPEFNEGMITQTGSIIIAHNTAGQSGNGYGGAIAGWVCLDYSYAKVYGNAAIGTNAKGGAIYGFLRQYEASIYENYTTGVGPGVYVTNQNLCICANADMNMYSNFYAESITVNEILPTPRRGDIYFATGYKMDLRDDKYPPSATNGVKAYIEMQAETGNFMSTWTNDYYKACHLFAANIGYKINESGANLTLATVSGNVNIDISAHQYTHIYPTYYGLGEGSTTNTNYYSFSSSETNRYVFSGTQTIASKNVQILGYNYGVNNVYLRFSNLNLTASNQNNIFFLSPSYGPLNVYIELVGDSSITTNGTSVFSVGNASDGKDYSINVYFTGTGTITFNYTADNTYGHYSKNGFATYSTHVGEVHIYNTNNEDITIYERVSELIQNIGGEITYTKTIRERIDTARAAYDALDPELQLKVINRDYLLNADENYKKASVKDVIALISKIPVPVVFTSECKETIEAARAAYDAVDNQELRELFAPNDPQEAVTNRQKLFNAEEIYSTMQTNEWNELITNGIALPDDLTYNGNPKEVALTYNDAILTVNVEYFKKNANNEYEGVSSCINAGDYKAIISSTVNNEPVSTEVTFTISKAPAPAPSDTPETIDVGENWTLADVELPDGWRWVADSTTPIGDSGVHEFEAVYNPDRSNYLDYNPATVTLTIKHIHNSITFTAWTSTDSLPTEAGNYYLENDVKILTTWTVPSGTTNLCLNGHGVIMKSSDQSVITVGSVATLNVYDCGETTHYFDVNSNNCAQNINETEGSGRNSFVGGYITGGQGTDLGSNRVLGGGIFVNGGYLHMYGGTVIGNSMTREFVKGAGVWVGYSGTFIMEEGVAIQYNFSDNVGGGVCVGVIFDADSVGTFVMNGGEISNNRAAAGGGIMLRAGQITLNGGVIAYNSVRDSGGAIDFEYFSYSTLRIGGNPVINNNFKYTSGVDENIVLRGGDTIPTIAISSELTSSANIYLLRGNGFNPTTAKAGVFIDGWSSFMGDAKPSDYFHSDNQDNVIYLYQDKVYFGPQPHLHDDILFTAWTSTDGLPSLAGDYYLTNDVNIDSTWTVPSGTTNLCLNGHGITMTGSGSVININDGNTLNLYDCDALTTRYYTIESPKVNGAGLAIVCDEDTYNSASENSRGTFKGGYITGGVSTAGGGVCIDNGTFNMYGGTIIGNRASGDSVTYGGGVALRSTSGTNDAFTMRGGAILGNTGLCGGGISVYKSSTFTLIDGEIKYNYSGYNGGGVHTDGTNTTASVIVSGGEIKNNYTIGNNWGKGGAILLSNASLTLSGNPKITDNICSEETNNVYFATEQNQTGKAYIVGTLNSETVIGITMKNPGVFTSSEDVSYNVIDNFVSDDEDYIVFKNGDGQLYLGIPIASVTNGETTTIYSILDDAVNAWVDGSTLTLLADVTITSKIQKGNIPSLTLDLNGKTITLNSSASEQRVIQINGLGSVLNIIDSSGTNSGRLTGINPGASDNGWSGALYINSGAIVNMYGGTISGNASTNGAGVWIDGRGHVGQAQFNMYGGLITGNTATNGGGVYVGCWLNTADPTTAYFNMYGGTITDNTATNGSNVYIDYGIMTMTGGTINGGVEHSDISDDYVVVTFDANDGLGTMSDQYVKVSTDTKIKDNEYYNLEAVKSIGFTREGYTLVGWNTQADGLGDNYVPGESSINISENITLYAKWDADATIKWSIRIKAKSSLSIDPAGIIEDNETIVRVYDVTLYKIIVIDGVEQEPIAAQPSDIGPGATITVKITIPDLLIGKNFRILHVHAIDDYEFVTYSTDTAGLRVTIANVDRLSDFAFVAFKSDVIPEEPDEGDKGDEGGEGGGENNPIEPAPEKEDDPNIDNWTLTPKDEGGEGGEGEGGDPQKPAVEVALEDCEPQEGVTLEIEVRTDVSQEIAESDNSVLKDRMQSDDEIAIVYDVKLIRITTDPVTGIELREEIQPSDVKPGAVVVINMDIPEALRGKAFKVLHVHAEDDINEIPDSAYTISEDGKVVTVRVTRLSEFALLGKKAGDSEPVGPNIIPDWAIALIVIGGAFAILLIGLLIFFFIKRDKKEKEQDVKEIPIAKEETLEDPKVEESEDEGIGLKESIKIATTATRSEKITKAFINAYLGKSYANCVEINTRENYTKTGLPLADTHYVKDKDGKMVCFIYVYETDGATMLLLKTKDALGKELEKECKNAHKSAFPKSKDKWYSIVIDDSLSNEQVLDMLDRTIAVYTGAKIQKRNFEPIENEGLGLKDSLAIAATATRSEKITKAFINAYLTKKYPDVVEINTRENYTKTGLPLADTHYVTTKDGNKICFIYAYETDGATMLLLKTKDALGEELAKDYKTVNKSAFPKAKERWYSVVIDDSLTDEAVKYMIDRTIALYTGATIQKQTFAPIQTVKKVTVAEAINMIEDDVAKSAIIVESTGEKATGKKSIVNIDILSNNFKNGDVVNIDALKAKKLIPNKVGYVKLLARGSLDKKLHVELQDYSIEAVKMVIATGGTVKKV